MSDTKISQLSQVTSVGGTELIPLITNYPANPTSSAITVANLVANLNVASVTSNGISIFDVYTPVSSSAGVAANTIFFDSNYLYVVVANNVIKRVALSAF